ncbi:Ribonucleoprotein LSM domain protein [Kalmanozyma brasiliensis GHG001]|uniref:Sm domain-containing protein n=1 Tax=Kalmanozyma brasiliensis (strain GHG001) TaxID=1365824 RepID=V5GU92_KALBG|nr:Ribonucleoprotein LSM domain protein [Kalmanozyma brasiliensis GHG001]EST09477.1 Ribonucleoprotein LSM domain protein [Kalmanozyma brasiliensis GHG001]
MNEAATKAATAAKTIETNFVGRTSIVHIPDGRAFCGTFVCVDSGKNIILGNTEEMRVTPEGRSSSRNVGMVMIPGDCVVKVEVQEDATQTQHAPPQPSLAQAGWPDDESLYS